MAGEDHLVKGMVCCLQLNLHALFMTEYLLHRRVKMQGYAIAQLRQHGMEILSRTARYHIPLRAVGDIQQTVMLKEAQKQRQRKTTHLLKRARPDGGPHWQNVMT